MAHNIEYNSNRESHSFYSRKELPWHGLGQIVEKAVTAEEALHLANLDYEVGLQPIFASFIPPKHVAVPIIKDDSCQYSIHTKGGMDTGLIIPKKGVLMPNNKAVCRLDTYEPLGIVGNKYTVVQNVESLSFIYDILKHNPDIKEKNDIIIETAGVLGNGERIFVTAKLPKGFRIGEEKENTELYLVFTNSHDGSSSLTAMVTPIRVVCNNTLTCALKHNKTKVSFKHTKNISTAMKEGLTLLKISYDSFNNNMQLYNSLLNIKVDSALLDDLIYKAMLDDNQYMNVKKFGLSNISTDVISTRTRNTITEARNFVDFGVGQTTNRGTAYWAYMGLNSYLNNGNTYKNSEAKFDNFIGNGTASKQDIRMLNTVMQLM